MADNQNQNNLQDSLTENRNDPTSKGTNAPEAAPEKKGFFRRYTMFDLVIMAVMAALGVALKPLLVPLAHAVTGPLGIPSGAVAGGLYMMWIVVGYGLVQKHGTAILICLVQALIVMFTGIVGSHGIMTLVSYTVPGILMELGLLIIRHSVCCRGCAFFSGMLCNLAGTFAVNSIFFRLPVIYLILTLAVSALSGGVGGLLAWQLLLLLKKYNIGNLGNAEEECQTDEDEMADW